MAEPNYDLYNWMLKTYGMPAAEWYLNNPTKQPGGNPFLPKGAYVPQADAGGGNTYASAASDIEEASLTVPGDNFQQLLNSLDPSFKEELESIPDLTEEERKDILYNYSARQQLGINDSPFAGYETDRFGNYRIPTNDPLVTYDPYYGQYGGYSTKEDLGFSPSSVLYDRYADWLKNNPVPIEESMVARAIRNDPTLGGTAGYSPEYADGLYRLSLTDEHRRQLAEYDAAEAAREKAFEDLYKTPLSQIQYQKYSDAPSLDAFRQQFQSLGIEIPLTSGDWTYFVRSATELDPEVQRFGAYNVGRSDYRTARQNEGIQTNIEILKQQASEGIEGSQQFLNDYVEKGGEGTEPQYGPRGEILGDVAVQYGDGFPKTPSWMKELDRLYKETKDKPFKPGTPKPGRGLGDVWEGPVRDASTPAPVDVRVARAAQQSDEQKQKLAQQSEFDLSKEKQLASARAAEAYRQAAAIEDPFRAAARMG